MCALSCSVNLSSVSFISYQSHVSSNFSFPPTETRFWKHSRDAGGDNPGDLFPPWLYQGSMTPTGQESPFTPSSWIVLHGGAAIRAVKENDLQAVA